MKKILFFTILYITGAICMNAQTTVLTPDTMFAQSQQTGLDYVLRLDPDRLLAPCYFAVGKLPKGSTYGGWESQQIQGHSLGHYLSALSGFVYQTKSKEAKEKLDYTVKCLKEIQRKDGYVGGIPSTPFDTTFSSNGNFAVDRFGLSNWWVPWYSVHKIYAGLIDAYMFGGNKDALEIVKKMADWAIAGTDKMTDEQMQKMLTCEHGGMCKVFADLYGITKDERYLKAAERWIHHEIIDPAIKQRDNLQGYHANTQIPKFLGIARLYEVTGKKEYRTAAEFFFNTVTKKRSYVIGGNSIGEHFGPEYSEKLGRDTCETCNTYNMLELAEHMFDWNRTADIADYYETALYNHILASQDPQTGAKTYFVSMLPGFYKVYGSFENAFWCCTGTGMENPERYNRFVALDKDGTIYLNLFIPSTVTTEDGWKFKIDTNFPYSQNATVTVLSAGKNPRNLKIRAPSWIEGAEKGADGYRDAGQLSAGKNIQIDLPMELNIRRARDRSGNFSVLYGPIVLAADIGNKNMPRDIVDNQLVYMNSPAQKVSTITADLNAPQNWITKTDAATLTFTTKASAAENNVSYTLKPFYGIHHTRYATYFASNNAVEDARTAKFEKITVDMVEPGRQQSEIEHRYKAEGTAMGYLSSIDRNYRQLTQASDSFSYRVKFDPKKANTIVLTVYGKDKGTISISIDGKEIAQKTLTGEKGDSLVDIEIPISLQAIQEAAKGKASLRQVVTITTPDTTADIKVLEFRITH